MSCGKCDGCLMEKARQWAVRCMHEAQLHEKNCFVTLTYRDAPERLVYEDFRLFLRRLRKRGAVRFYVAGEYGGQGGRAHWHALLFGYDFADREYWRESPGGARLYRSALLEQLWPHGFSSVGTVTFQSAAYVARYVLKADQGGGFSRMSRMPGIGSGWYDRYADDVRDGKVVVEGAQQNAPRFYLRRMKAAQPFRYRKVMFQRELEAREGIAEQLPGRLEPRRDVAAARRGLLKRTF